MSGQTSRTSRRFKASGRMQAAVDPKTRERDRALGEVILGSLKGVADQEVVVQVRDGFVTLKGSLQTYRQKERLHRFVMGLSGVRALKDLIRIEPRETVADQKIALHIRQALDAHSEIPPGTAVVHVHEGIVTLSGHVRVLEERFIAESVASHCRGVTKVINELSVDPLEEVSDEAACRAIRGALAYCEEFETDGVTVSCADGKACLRGEVPTVLDKMLAEELARMQAGVRSVENNIQVVPQIGKE